MLAVALTLSFQASFQPQRISFQLGIVDSRCRRESAFSTAPPHLLALSRGSWPSPYRRWTVWEAWQVGDGSVNSLSPALFTHRLSLGIQIFILEGMITVLTGFAVFWLLPNSPESSTWLTPREQYFIRFRLEQDAGTKEGRVNTNEKFELKYLIRALTDWKLWLMVFVYVRVSSYSTAKRLLTICHSAISGALRMYHSLMQSALADYGLTAFPTLRSPSLLPRSSSTWDIRLPKPSFSPSRSILQQ